MKGFVGDWTYRQKSSARRAGELQYLGDMPWVSRATAMRPDSRYLASDAGDVNTSNIIANVIAGCALRSVVIDHMIETSPGSKSVTHCGRGDTYGRRSRPAPMSPEYRVEMPSAPLLLPALTTSSNKRGAGSPKFFHACSRITSRAFLSVRSPRKAG
jgi:hypothetical protein